MTKRPTRSDKYQYLLLESSYTDEMMMHFSNQQSLGYCLDPFRYDERVEVLLDELRAEFWKVAEAHLTDMQKKVLRLRADGYTQCEIADIMGVNQSSITKCINGNTDYKNFDGTGQPKVFGGAIKKLKKLMEKNQRIKEILAELNELREEKW